jgi:hypothetical protein
MPRDTVEPWLYPIGVEEPQRITADNQQVNRLTVEIVFIPRESIPALYSQVELQLLGGHPKPASEGHLKTGQL